MDAEAGLVPQTQAHQQHQRQTGICKYKIRLILTLNMSTFSCSSETDASELQENLKHASSVLLYIVVCVTIHKIWLYVK